MRRYRTAAAVLLAAAAIAVLIAWVLRPKPVPAEAATVTRGVLETAVEAEAKTRVRDPYVVAATVAGRLKRVYLREGDAVRKGRLLASIDPLPVTARIAQIRAQLAEVGAQRAGVESLRPKPENLAQARARETQAQAAYAQAQRELQRAQALAASGDIPQSRLEQARLIADSSAQDLAAAKAALAETSSKRSDPDYLLRVYDQQSARLRAELQTLEDQAARTQLRSPIAGTVLRVLQRSETSVSEGTPIVQIGDTRGLEIVADVLSEDAVAIRSGDPMIVERGAGTSPLQARVTRIEPAARTRVSALGVEEQRVNVVGRFSAVPPAVGDEYRLDVRIVTWKGTVLRVPAGALFRCGERWCAYHIVGGRARTTAVSLGHRSADAAEVLSGLRAGDRVVVHPSDRVSDGTLIQVPSAHQESP